MEEGPSDTDYGMREIAALDLDGNLVVFFTRVEPRAVRIPEAVTG